MNQKDKESLKNLILSLTGMGETPLENASNYDFYWTIKKEIINSIFEILEKSNIINNQKGNQYCLNCFYGTNREYPIHCLKHAPVVSFSESFHEPTPAWPQMFPGQWCGDWRIKE
jgi:hypothetical protein